MNHIDEEVWTESGDWQLQGYIKSEIDSNPYNVGRKKWYKSLVFSTTYLRQIKENHRPTTLWKDLVALWEVSHRQGDAVLGKKSCQAIVVGDECSEGTHDTTSLSSTAK